MRINKSILVSLMTVFILAGCSSTEEKGKETLGDSQIKPLEGITTEGYSDQSQITGNELSPEEMGVEFTDPQNPLSQHKIYFQFDSSQVEDEFIPVIAAHAQYLLTHPNLLLILEGHADERGSREYNIALGEQRSKSVARMMVAQGVPLNQLEEVSYGEEKPAAFGNDEASWRLNRRVELVYQGR